MNSRTFLYARVSTDEQSLDRQIIAMKEYCARENIVIDEREIFTDTFTGKTIERENYQIMKHFLRPGDTVIFKELDRIARRKSLIMDELDWFQKNNIRVKILDIPTTLIELPEGQEWVFELINKILMEVLSTIAEDELRRMKKRQREGIEAARGRGVHMGRPKAEYPDDWDDVYMEWKNKNITAKEAMEQLGLKRTTFYKLAKLYEGNL